MLSRNPFSASELIDNLKPPIIVIGMHRSGTTLVSQLLSELGCKMGINVDRHNESICFLRINDAILRLNNANWLNPKKFLDRLDDQEFIDEMREMAQQEILKNFHLHGSVSPEQLWGWKDPRTTLTLPIWLEIFPDARIVFVTRNGIDVALSLKRRAWKHLLKLRKNNIERLFPLTALVKGFFLWEQYCKLGFKYCELLGQKNCYHLEYEKIIFGTENQMQLLAEYLGLNTENNAFENFIKNIIREPTKISGLEKVWIKILFRTRILNVGFLNKLGYFLP